MTTNEKILYLCEKNGISKAKLERDLGFSNGSLLKHEYIRHDRLLLIADYFDVSMDYLSREELEDIDSSDMIEYDNSTHTWNVGDKEYYFNEQTADIAQKIYDSKEMQLLFDAAQDVKPEDLDVVYNMLLALKRKEEG